ncbi:MAG: hypothetical protein LQ350_005158 [Teloschistes chrysophthalmus]|nr:MAG: hypothetical protein LQ350_005158 [Niorma chrysophthalma]
MWVPSQRLGGQSQIPPRPSSNCRLRTSGHCSNYPSSNTRPTWVTEVEDHFTQPAGYGLLPRLQQQQFPSAANPSAFYGQQGSGSSFMPAPNHRQQPFPAAFPPGFQQQQGAGPSYSVAVPRQHPFYGQLALDPSLYDTPNHHQQPFPRFHQQQEVGSFSSVAVSLQQHQPLLLAEDPAAQQIHDQALDDDADADADGEPDSGPYYPSSTFSYPSPPTATTNPPSGRRHHGPTIRRRRCRC